MDTISDFEALLTKYSGGRLPPLVDLDNPELGLIDVELLWIYHSGLRSWLAAPLGLLLPADSYSDIDEKWRSGDFRLNEWALQDWTPFCRSLRATAAGNAACESCDRHWAAVAEREGDAVAYLCDHGMIDIAVPILLKDQVAAVVFCGQFKPRGEAIWNPELIQNGGLFRPLLPGEEGADVWATASLQRIHNIAQEVGLPEGTLFESLSHGVDPNVEVSPQDVVRIQQSLRRIAVQISNLATSTYELEKGKVIDLIRSRITGSLVPIGATEDLAVVWMRLSDSLAYVVRYFALDYTLILSCCTEGRNQIKLLSQAGLSERKFPIGEESGVARLALSRLKDAVCDSEEPMSLTLRDYKDLPVFGDLHRLHHGRSQQVGVISLPISRGSAPVAMIMGRFRENTKVSALNPDDREALNRIVEGIALVTEIALLVEELETTGHEQVMFLEDVAHSIRTPIQNIVVEAEVLTRGLASPEDIGRRVRRIAAQVRRLHLLSQKVWTLDNLDRGMLTVGQAEPVNIYQTIMEHRKSLLGLARSRGIEISVDSELANWPTISVNRDFFSQVILNLLDNAIKYSRDKAEVRVDGRRVPSDIIDGEPVPGGITLSFVNRGIPIKYEDKDRIFDRYYRTHEAKEYIPTGTGIGLAIVKAFVDHYGGGVEVNSLPVSGTRDYITEFRIYIPQGGAYDGQGSFPGRRKSPC